MRIDRRGLLFGGTVSAALVAGGARKARSASPLKIGLVLPMTGPFASTGRASETAVRLWLEERGGRIAGRTVELLVRDDTGVADTGRRLAQELVVREGVDVLMGFGLTPIALACAPIAEQAGKLMVVTAAATSIITERASVIVRTSFTLPQATLGIARWAPKNGLSSAVSLVSDYAPGHDAEKAFEQLFTAAGGTVLEKLRAPLQSPDFAPLLQRAKDAKPQALFVFVPSGVGAQLMKQAAERDLAGAGIRLIGTGDLTDDDILPQMGEVAIGTTTSHHYSAAHPSPENERFRANYQRLSGGRRPNFMAVGAWDGMELVARALERTGGDAEGKKLVEAAKGLSWTSPRGPIAIDPATRDIVQDIYIRRVERGKDGELWNVEFDRIPAVADPVKAGLVR